MNGNTELTPAQQFAVKLRKVADYFDAHPGLPEPYLDRIDIYCFKNHSTGETEKQMFQRIAKLMGPTVKKVDETFFNLRTDPEKTGLRIELSAHRDQVCRRIEKYVTVPAQIIPAQPAREEEVIPEHEEVRYEWECPESVLSQD